jgi:hypothetical protein
VLHTPLTSSFLVWPLIRFREEYKYLRNFIYIYILHFKIIITYVFSSPQRVKQLRNKIPPTLLQREWFTYLRNLCGCASCWAGYLCGDAFPSYFKCTGSNYSQVTEYAVYELSSPTTIIQGKFGAKTSCNRPQPTKYKHAFISLQAAQHHARCAECILCHLTEKHTPYILLSILRRTRSWRHTSTWLMLLPGNQNRAQEDRKMVTQKISSCLNKIWYGSR